jgi:hypothetical protein
LLLLLWLLNVVERVEKIAISLLFFRFLFVFLGFSPITTAVAMMAQEDETSIHKLLISAVHPVEESVGGPAASALMHKKTTTPLHLGAPGAVVFPKQQLSTAGEIELEQVVQKAQGYGEVGAAVTTSVVAAAESPELPAVSSSLSGELQLIQQPQQHKRDVRGIGFTVMPSVSAMTDDELLQQQDLVMLVQKRSADESFTLQNGAGASTESNIAAAASPKLMRSTAALDQNGEVRTSAGGGGGGEQLEHRGKGGLAKKAQARSSALHKEIHNVVITAHPLPAAITEKPEMEINVQKKEGRGAGLKVTFVDQDLESNCSCSSSPPPATNKALNSARGSGSSSWQQQLRRDDGAGCTTKLLRSAAAAPGASSTPSPRKAAAVSTAMTKHAAADFKQVQQQKKKKQEAHHAGKLIMKAASTVASSSSSQLQLHTSSSTRDSLSSPPEIVLDSSANLATSKYLDSRNHGGDDWELEEGLKSLDSSSPSFFSGGGGAGASFDTRASSKLLLSSETSSIRLSPNLQKHHHHVAAAAFHMRDKPFILGSDGSEILAALAAQDPDDDDDDDEGKVAMLCSSMADTNKLSGDLGKLLGTVYGKLRRPSSGSETMATTTHTKSSHTTTSNHNSISKGDKKKNKSQIASTSSATKSSSVGYGLGAQKFEIGSYTSLKLLQECCSIELKDTTLASKLTGTPRKMRDKLGPHRHYYRGITMRLEQKLK